MGDDILDEALAMLESTGPHYGPFGFANHGPMAADALVRLGRDDDVLRWVEAYRTHLDDAPRPGTPVDPADQREALGKPDRYADWLARFEYELAERTWQDVVREFGGVLAPGASADAYHGVIRTAHAVRGLESAAGRLRVGELARGLALWASTYQELAGTPGRPGRLAPAEAIDRVHTLTDDERGEPTSIVDGLRRLDQMPAFDDVVNLVAVGPDEDAALSAIAATFARVLLEHAHDHVSAIVFVHTVTGPSAVQLLLPHLDEEARATAVQYAWQGSAGIYAVYGGEPHSGEVQTPDVDGLVDRAVASGDEHAIKLAEACVRQQAATADDAFLTASARATALLGGG